MLECRPAWGFRQGWRGSVTLRAPSGVVREKLVLIFQMVTGSAGHWKWRAVKSAAGGRFVVG